MNGWTIGVIGGSGLYAIDGVEGEWVDVDTPWGKPSDAIFRGRLGDVGVAFLPRHGRGHRIAPGELNARANIDALKRLGVTDVLSISSVGGLQEERAPGSFTIVDQFIAGNFQAINQQMVVAMRMMFPAETLKASWDTMNEEFGAYVSHDAPAVFQDDDKDAFIRVPLHFAHHDTRMQIVCSSNSDGQIASLAFL